MIISSWDVNLQHFFTKESLVSILNEVEPMVLKKSKIWKVLMDGRRSTDDTETSQAFQLMWAKATSSQLVKNVVTC